MLVRGVVVPEAEIELEPISCSIRVVVEEVRGVEGRPKEALAKP